MTWHLFDLKPQPEAKLVPEDTYMTSFDAATEDEVKKVILSSASTSSYLDPIPTHILKQCLHVLLPVITRITNLSFATATVPLFLKIPAVIPLLNKLFLDPEVFCNLRPISTVPFISKTLACIACSRMLVYIMIETNCMSKCSRPTDLGTLQRRHC